MNLYLQFSAFCCLGKIIIFTFGRFLFPFQSTALVEMPLNMCSYLQSLYHWFPTPLPPGRICSYPLPASSVTGVPHPHFHCILEWDRLWGPSYRRVPCRKWLKPLYHMILGEEALVGPPSWLAALCLSLTLVLGNGGLLSQAALPGFRIDGLCFLDQFPISYILTASVWGLLLSIPILAHICFLLASCSLQDPWAQLNAVRNKL